jgi:hypothetical protein
MLWNPFFIYTLIDGPIIFNEPNNNENKKKYYGKNRIPHDKKELVIKITSSS